MCVCVYKEALIPLGVLSSVKWNTESLHCLVYINGQWIKTFNMLLRIVLPHRSLVECSVVVCFRLLVHLVNVLVQIGAWF